MGDAYVPWLDVNSKQRKAQPHISNDTFNLSFNQTLDFRLFH